MTIPPTNKRAVLTFFCFFLRVRFQPRKTVAQEPKTLGKLSNFQQQVIISAEALNFISDGGWICPHKEHEDATLTKSGMFFFRCFKPQWSNIFFRCEISKKESCHRSRGITTRNIEQEILDQLQLLYLLSKWITSSIKFIFSAQFTLHWEFTYV